MDVTESKAFRLFILSYLHKIAIAGLAAAALAALLWMGAQREAYLDRRDTWTLDAAGFAQIAKDARSLVASGAEDLTGARSSLMQDGTPTIEQYQTAASVIGSVSRGFGGRARIYGSRPEFVAAIQARVNARVWSLGGKIVENAHAMTAEKIREERQEKLDKAIRQAQTWVQATIAASQPLIDAAVPDRPSTALPGTSLRPRNMFDERSSLHVLFQLLWYGLLAVIAVCLSYLLIVLFAAIPGTSGESYWTKKLTDLVAGIVPTAGRSIGPLVGTALLAGAVIAPTVSATAPGGTSRDSERVVVEKIWIKNDPEVVECPKRLSDTIIVQDGRIFVANDFNLSSTVIDEARLAAAVVEKAAPGIQEAAKNVEDALAARLNATNDRIASLGQSNARVERQQDALLRVADSTARVTGSTLTVAQDVRTATGGIATDLSTLQREINGAACDIQDHQGEQDRLVGNNTLQLVEADHRPWLQRTFGLTLFRVGPAIADAFAREIDGRSGSDVLRSQPRASFVARATAAALFEMSREEPMNRWEFERTYRDALEHEGLTELEVEREITERLGRLLRVSALRR